MMIETKLNRPQANSTRVVRRPQLLQKLNEGLHCKLSLITAPAGYGKTTLLTEWIESLCAPVAWVSLDDRDRDSSRLWSYTVAALKKEVPSFDARDILRFTSADPSGEMVVAALINRLNRLTETIIIVWDDFHYVDEPLTLKGVAYFLKNVPNHVHLYIVSRTIPAIPLARMRVKEMVNEIKTADLRFSIEELIDFFKERVHTHLSMREIEVLLEQTEGWVTGICLAELYLRTKDGSKSNIRELSEYRNVSDYFLEEVFNDQTEKMKQFLLRTSILERMNAELCHAVTGMEFCGEYLQQLEQNNLFFIPLDEQRKWYRYHHLFQDFLRRKLKESMPEQVNELQQRAGSWFEENGYTEEAMEYYLASKQYEGALRLLEKLTPLYIHSELGTLKRWFEAIPVAVLFEKPSLLLNKYLLLLMWGETETIQEKITWLEKQWTEKNIQIREEEHVSFHEGLLMLRVIASFFMREFEASIRYSEQYLHLYPQGVFFNSFGMEGDFEVPNWSLMETIGNLQERENIIRHLLAIWSETNHYYLQAEFCIGYGDIMYEWNRLEEAETYWQRAKQLGETHQNKLITSISSLLLAKLYIAKNEIKKMEKMLVQLNDEKEKQKYPKMYKFIEMYQVYLRLIQGKQSLTWLANCDLRVTDEIPNTMLLEYSVFAYSLIKQDKRDEAEKVFRRLIKIAKDSRKTGEQIRLLIQYSLVLNQNENETKSFQVLEEALALGEKGGYIRTFIDAGAIELLHRYLAARQKQQILLSSKISLQYVKRLVGLMQLPLEIPERQANLLTTQETIVLQLIIDGLTNQEIAKQLNIALSTVKTHINHLYGKLQVKNRMQARNRAKEWRIIGETSSKKQG